MDGFLHLSVFASFIDSFFGHQSGQPAPYSGSGATSTRIHQKRHRGRGKGVVGGPSGVSDSQGGGGPW